MSKLFKLITAHAFDAIDLIDQVIDMVDPKDAAAAHALIAVIKTVVTAVRQGKDRELTPEEVQQHIQVAVDEFVNKQSGIAKNKAEARSELDKKFPT